MSLIVNHNLMAQNVANNLNSHYSRLATSTERLSSGLRINSAADDAAGLAIRELMRADIASLHQGMRNANDAISLIQTADAALAVIDEKLIRMKELAEQAATGTYDSTQRLMISSEFAQMASEIDRIANATDFNGIHLLNGNLANAHNGKGLNATGALKIHFGSGNDKAEDYYYIQIPSSTTDSLFAPESYTETVTSDITIPAVTSGLVEEGNDLAALKANQINGNEFRFSVYGRNGGENDQSWYQGLDRYYLPVGLKNVKIRSVNGHPLPFHKPHVSLFSKDGSQLTGYPATDNSAWWNGLTGDKIIEYNQTFNSDATYNPVGGIILAGSSVTKNGMTVTLNTDQAETFGQWEEMTIDEIKEDLIFIIGGHFNSGICNKYHLEITADLPDDYDDDWLQTNLFDSVESEMTIATQTYTVEHEDRVEMTIETQEDAQKMLGHVDGAIEQKDKIRAHLGALQNRLENTVTNLTIQSENLQAAESRISDSDVATEMTNFVRNQILTQSAVAMLSQANSLPQMALQLIGG